jgi:hypothetical protein
MMNLNNNYLRNINFVLYTNTEKEAVLQMGLGITNLLKKPCEKKDLEKVFNRIDLV